MKIGVLADTHIHDLNSARQLADFLLQGPFSDVDAVLHAGDAVIPGLEDCFAPLSWYAVRGNMDQTLSDLPISRVVSLADKRIGMIHGWGSSDNIDQRVVEHFAGQPLDAIVFGHSHAPLCRRYGSLLLFNPGSATDRRHAAHHSVGILTLGKKITGEIIAID